MEEKSFKWILINNEIRISGAAYHRYLLEKNENTCDGGGLVSIDKEDKLIIFFGESQDFGKVKKDVLEKAIEENRKRIDYCLYFLFNQTDTNDYEIKIL